MNTHADIIDALGGYAIVAEGTAVPHGTVAAWRSRKSIPVGHWLAIVDMARRAGLRDITFELLVHTTPRRKTAG